MTVVSSAVMCSTKLQNNTKMFFSEVKQYRNPNGRTHVCDEFLARLLGSFVVHVNENECCLGRIHNPNRKNN